MGQHAIARRQPRLPKAQGVSGGAGVEAQHRVIIRRTGRPNRVSILGSNLTGTDQTPPAGHSPKTSYQDADICQSKEVSSEQRPLSNPGTTLSLCDKEGRATPTSNRSFARRYAAAPGRLALPSHPHAPIPSILLSTVIPAKAGMHRPSLVIRPPNTERYHFLGRRFYIGQTAMLKLDHQTDR